MQAAAVAEAEAEDLVEAVEAGVKAEAAEDLHGEAVEGAQESRP